MLHLLLHMAHAGRQLTSEDLARMLRTNPVVVRRMLAGLRERGLVTAEKGHGGGWVVARSLADVTLLEVYEALGAPTLFAIGNRREAGPCLLEQAVNARLDGTLAEAEAMVRARLGEVTLASLAEAFERQVPHGHHALEHAHEHDPDPDAEA